MNHKSYKYIVVLGDGMADHPIPQLNGLTPLAYAKTPMWDVLAPKSLVGTLHTTPISMSAGSDICNLSVMGYNPQIYHTGRSPIEAASIGVPMKDSDITFRTNFVTLGDETDYGQKTMVDYSAGEISTQEADALIQTLNETLANDHMHFFTGTSYRHILCVDAIEKDIDLTPPHDISSQKITEHLPAHPALLALQIKSYDILKNHPVNLARIAQGKSPANSIWLWGQGTKMVIPSFFEKYGAKGGVISAVDLVKGIAVSAKMDVFEVEGATGTYETNFEGKTQMAISKLREGYDFVYIHVEAPDECGHRGQLKEKIYSIEQLDCMTKTIYDAMKADGVPFKILVTPDHETPIETLTHGRTPVPFMLYDSLQQKDNQGSVYTEAYANTTTVSIKDGYTLMDFFMEK